MQNTNLTKEKQDKIDKMSRYQLCSMWRNAPIGSDFWQGEQGKYAEARLKALGGFSVEISKSIGWDNV